MNTNARLALFALALLAGCSSIDTGGNKNNLMIPAQTFNVSQSVTVTAEGVVAAAIALMVIDPLAPNWWVDDAKLGGNRFQITLTKKRFTTGGDGEAEQVFRSRAQDLARGNGSGTYRIVEFSEGVESHVLIARRVARGVVEVLP